jgi:hypothetical protein
MATIVSNAAQARDLRWRGTRTAAHRIIEEIDDQHAAEPRNIVKFKHRCPFGELRPVPRPKGGESALYLPRAEKEWRRPLYDFGVR